MLKHVIIKKKPILHLSQLRRFQDTGTVPLSLPAPVVSGTPAYTQLQLDDQVAGLSFSAGDYITYKAMRNVQDLRGIYYCKEIVTELEKIPSWSPSKFPNICLVIPAHEGFLNQPREWMWISGWGMEKLIGNLYTKLIDDKVLDRIKADIDKRNAPFQEPEDFYGSC